MYFWLTKRLFSHSRYTVVQYEIRPSLTFKVGLPHTKNHTKIKEIRDNRVENR